MLDLDDQSLPRVLVEDGQHAYGSSIMGLVGHEVVGPDVIPVTRPQTDARPVVEGEPASLRLPLRHVEPLLTPNALHALVIHSPPLAPQKHRHAPVSVPTELLGQLDGAADLRPMSSPRWPAGVAVTPTPLDTQP